MSEEQRDRLSNLEEKLGQMRLRARLNKVLVASAWGVGLGAVLTALLIVVDRLAFLSAVPVNTIAPVAGGLVFLFFLVRYGFMPKIDNLALLVRADERFEEKELLSSAYAFDRDTDEDSPLVREVIERADRHSEKLEPAAVVPVKFRRGFALVGVALLMAAGSYFLPYAGFTGAATAQQQNEVVKEHAKELEELAKQVEKNEEIDEQTRKEITRELEKTAEDFKKGRTSPDKAIRELARLENKLEKKAKQSDGERSSNVGSKLSQAAKQQNLSEGMQKAAASGDVGEFMKKMQQKLDKAQSEGRPLSEKEIEELEKSLDALEQAVNESDMSASEKQQMKQKIEQAKQALQQQKKAAQKARQQAKNAVQQAKKLANQLNKQGNQQLSKQLKQQAQQLQKQMQQGGTPKQQTVQQMKQAANQAQQYAQKQMSQGQMSQRQGQQMQQSAKKLKQALQQSQSGGQKSSQQLRQAMQGMAKQGQSGGKKSGKAGGGQMMGLQGSRGQQLAKQLNSSISRMQRGISSGACKANPNCKGGGKFGSRQSAGGGKAGSNWGVGSTQRQARGGQVDPSKANRDQRQKSGEIRSTGSTQFTPLHGRQDSQSQGNNTRVRTERRNQDGPVDTKKVQSLPTDQEAMTDYYEVVQDEVQREEQAMNRTELPPKYKDMVKGYFDQLSGQGSGSGSGSSSGDSSGSSASESSGGSGSGENGSSSE